MHPKTQLELPAHRFLGGRGGDPRVFVWLERPRRRVLLECSGRRFLAAGGSVVERTPGTELGASAAAQTPSGVRFPRLGVSAKCPTSH